MTTSPLVTVHCDHTVGCVTCGDEAAPMRVLEVGSGTGLARCAAPGEAPVDVEVTLVEPVMPGDAVLVHAGVAIQTLDGEELA